MKFKKFMKRIKQLHKHLPEQVELPSEEWFKANVPKEGRIDYLARGVHKLLTVKLQEVDNIEEPAKNTNEDTTESLTGIDATLAERGSNYGKFENHAKLSQSLQVLFEGHVRRYGQPEKYTDSMNEAIQLIMHKLARIANGSPMYIENFRDICGYAQLIINELETTEGATDAKVSKIVREDNKWVEQ